MDADRLIGSLIRGALGGKRKRSRGAARFLTGRRGRGSSFLTGSTLLTAAGVAWGLWETMQKSTVPTGGPPLGGPTPASSTGPPAGGSGAPPPIPVPPGGAPPQTVASADDAAAGVSPDLLRVIRLTISAARADGSLTPQEEAAILEQARAAGAEAIVATELKRPRPLAEIVAGVSDPQARRDLYVLAFAIVRADETVTGAERIYLAQLAHQLGLDAAAVAELEQGAASRIQAASEEAED